MCGSCARLGLSCSFSRSDELNSAPSLQNELDKIEERLCSIVRAHDRKAFIRNHLSRSANAGRGPDILARERDIGIGGMNGDHGTEGPESTMIHTIFDMKAVAVIGEITNDPGFVARVSESRKYYYECYARNFEHVKPLVGSSEHLTEAEISEGLAQYYDPELAIGSQPIMSLYFTQEEVNSPEIHPLIKDMYTSSVMIYIFRRMGITGKKLYLALAQILRATSICGLRRPSFNLFKAVSFSLPLLGSSCSPPIVNFVCTMGWVMASQLRLNRATTYQSMPLLRRISIQMCWFSFVAYSMLMEILRFRPLGSHTWDSDFPVPYWEPAAQLKSINYVLELGKFYGENFRSIHMVATTSEVTPSIKSLVHDLDEGLEKSFEPVARNISELITNLVEYYNHAAYLCYCLLKLWIWSKLAFFERDLDAIEICRVAAQNVLKCSLIIARGSYGMTWTSVQAMNSAFETMVLLSVNSPQQENALFLALMQQSIQQFLEEWGPSDLKEGRTRIWQTLLDKLSALVNQPV